MTRICFIGAGSTVFMRNIVTDIMLDETFKSCHIALHDIDAERLKVSEAVARKIAASTDCQPTIVSTLDRREALIGADFVIVMIQVGGYRPSTVIDFDIPRKFGLRQTIADTLGIGGIMRGLRTVPVLGDIAGDMAECCPDAIMLQYVNPMAINCMALARMMPEITVIGLCHSVQGTALELARDLGEDPSAIRYHCAGINHVAFYDRFEKQHADGTREDLYPRLHALAAARSYASNEHGCANHVRYEMLQRLGYFLTESSEHFAEYVPWFIKRDRPDLIEKFEIPLDAYPARCEALAADWEAQKRALLSDEKLVCERSQEYAARIIHAVVTGEETVINANLPNAGCIANLPSDACVEVPCLVDHNGISPIQVGRIPPHLAALMQTQINVQTLVVEALVTGKREHVYHAAMLDPHTGAELSLDEIWQLVDALIEAHGDWLPPLA
ncbi:alpha-glucosidase/alpha-galactosidase [Pelagibius litoralis]|uniref:alpha-glucosidase/alpha-galactosidase n=1 Tax=Pelagibius litoralis TaxID=374515 RepID=UPI002AC336E7|nr:alpha-glucosidase/alpha-galactosidase [Pelagibius litoralis]